jgi:hypothetical protein
MLLQQHMSFSSAVTLISVAQITEIDIFTMILNRGMWHSQGQGQLIMMIVLIFTMVNGHRKCSLVHNCTCNINFQLHSVMAFATEMMVVVVKCLWLHSTVVFATESTMARDRILRLYSKITCAVAAAISHIQCGWHEHGESVRGVRWATGDE